MSAASVRYRAYAISSPPVAAHQRAQHDDQCSRSIAFRIPVANDKRPGALAKFPSAWMPLASAACAPIGPRAACTRTYRIQWPGLGT
jgi:hypothetical protein